MPVTSSGLILPKGYSTDVPGLDPTPKLPSIFDTSPHRNLGQPGITREIPQCPDDRLIATLVEYGQPRWAAEEVRNHPLCRFNAFRFWCDVQDAAEGDKEAKERVDYCRAMWQEMRKDELISDIPDHTIGLWER